MSQKSPKNLKSLGIKLEDIDLEQLNAISVPIKKRINALKNEQVKLLDLEKQFFEELHQLECKFAKLYEPIYEKRRKIVTGDLEPNEEETKWALDDKEEAEEAEEKKGDESKNGEDKIDESKLNESGKKLLNDLKEQLNLKKSSGENEKGIPNFWLETLQASRITSEMIQEHDEPVLAFLQDVRVKMHEQKPYGYTIEFEFAENPYFSNKVLTKTFELKMDVCAKDPFSFEGPELERCSGCKIDWKPNKNVTVKLVKKKIKGRNKKAPAKVITKEEKQESFFTFFETRPETHKSGANKKNRQTSESGESGKQVAIKANTSGTADEDNEEDEDEMDEETAHDLYLMTEFETGQYLKDKIIPKAVLYFSGELDDMDDDEDDYEDGEEYDDEDEDDDDDDEEDEEEDDDDDDDDDDNPKGQKKGGKGGKKGGKQGGGGGHKGGEGSGKPGEPTPSECKQN